MELERNERLIVKYNGDIVGYLAEYRNGDIAFQYDRDWVNYGFSISPYSLPLSNQIFINKKKTFDGLFGVFWDSLPDGWGELLVVRMLRKHGIDYDSLTPLQKLSIINKNGLGALEYEPNQRFAVDNSKLSLDELACEVERILNDEYESNNLDEIYNLGGSSGGARPKAHIKYDGEEWIVKFPCATDPKNIGEKEYKANQLAKKCGINVNEFKMFESKISNGYFGAKRFDRAQNKKLHVISLAALLETTHRIPNLDYGHLFQVIETISADKEKDLYEAFKRMCFNVYYKNRDDHSKNFAFIYDEKLRGYKLSPAYDLTSVPNKFEHEMTVNHNGLPKDEDLLAIAKEFKLSKAKCEKIIESIKEVIFES